MGHAADSVGPPHAYVLSVAGHVTELEAYRVGARALASRILGAQEAERIRVSRELHDGTGQALTLLLVRLQLVENMTNDAAVRHELVELRALVVDTLDGVRRLAVHLGPSVLEDLGLASALEWLVDRVRLEAGLRIVLGIERLSVEPAAPVALAMFRVAQEALTNVVRHARARTVSVRLEQRAGGLRLWVEDDGIGFDVSAARARPTESIGLFGMAERVALVDGTLEVLSEQGAGTRVLMRVPAGEE